MREKAFEKQNQDDLSSVEARKLYAVTSIVYDYTPILGLALIIEKEEESHNVNREEHDMTP